MAIQCNHSQYLNLNNNFALPQLIAQHNCTDHEPTNTPSAAPTALQVISDLTFNPMCAHNPMTTHCNKSQYLTSLNQICIHNPSTSQVRKSNLSNSLAFPYPPDPGEHVMKRSSISAGNQDFPVKWLCNQKSTFPPPPFTLSVISSLPCFTIVITTFAPAKSYYPLETMGRI